MVITSAILAIAAFTPAAAEPESWEVVIMDCSENAQDKFIVEDISSTDGVPPVTKGMDCAVALQQCIASGFAIIPEGGGAIHDWQVSKEHVLYTLVRTITHLTNHNGG